PFFSAVCADLGLHSFPTRRSSDLVGAALPHAAGLEVEDQGRPSGELQVVGDEERGLPLRQPLQRFDDGPFVLTVEARRRLVGEKDRKSTRLNSSHVSISYAVFCLK